MRLCFHAHACMRAGRRPQEGALGARRAAIRGRIAKQVCVCVCVCARMCVCACVCMRLCFHAHACMRAGRRPQEGALEARRAAIREGIAKQVCVWVRGGEEG